MIEPDGSLKVSFNQAVDGTIPPAVGIEVNRKQVTDFLVGDGLLNVIGSKQPQSEAASAYLETIFKKMGALTPSETPEKDQTEWTAKVLSDIGTAAADAAKKRTIDLLMTTYTRMATTAEALARVQAVQTILDTSHAGKPPATSSEEAS